MPRFGSVVTAMITPFDERGAIDLDGAATLARHLAGSGSDALVLAGSTGEGSVLSDEERLDLLETVSSAVDIPVIASTGTNDTAHSVRLTARAEAAGAAAVLVVTPYYNRPSAAGLAAHFRAVAAATELPVVLYDIPVRTGRRIGTALVVELAGTVDNIVAVKDATGDLAGAATIVSDSPEGFDVYCGDDSLTLPFVAVGAAGVVSVAAHWAGALFAEMIGRYRSGDVEGAIRANRALAESYRFQSTEEFPNPVPAKAACRALGLPAGQCRLPHPPAPGSLDETARSVVARAGRMHSQQSVA